MSRSHQNASRIAAVSRQRNADLLFPPGGSGLSGNVLADGIAARCATAFHQRGVAAVTARLATRGR